MIPNKPGIYEDIPFSDYLNIDAWSKSTLEQYLLSAAQAKEDVKTTDAMRIGSLLHTLILEPDKVSERLAIIPEGNKNAKAFKEAIAAQFGMAYEGKWSDMQQAIEAEHPELHLCTGEDMEGYKALAKAVSGKPEIKRLMQGSRREVTVLWERGDDLCKARVDALTNDWAIDFKSTVSSQPADFMRKAIKLGYHRQDAWYLEGLKANGWKGNGFAFVAFEKEAPYHPMIYTVDDELREYAKQELDSALAYAQHCRDTGNYPGYEGPKNELVRTIEAPGWYQPINISLG